jgi:CheY-like chemotaxis protein
MPKSLTLLLVEDSDRDAALLKLTLRRGGYDADVHRVDTLADLATQLGAGTWDVVISDFNLPGFDAFAARNMVLESGRDLPFIVLSADFSPTTIQQMTAAGIRHVSKYEIRNVVAIIDDYMRERS